MARGVNKTILVGNLGADPEIRYLPQGGAVASMSIATSEAWKDKNTGEMQERTEWHRLVVYNRLAEIAGEYLRKGSKIYVEGKLKTRKWTDQQEIERYTTEIIVAELQMLDSRPDGQQGGQNYQQPAQQQPRQQPAAAPAPRQATGQQGYQQQSPRQPAPAGYRGPQHQNQQPMPPPPDFDDDIPF